MGRVLQDRDLEKSADGTAVLSQAELPDDAREFAAFSERLP